MSNPTKIRHSFSCLFKIENKKKNKLSQMQNEAACLLILKTKIGKSSAKRVNQRVFAHSVDEK